MVTEGKQTVGVGRGNSPQPTLDIRWLIGGRITLLIVALCSAYVSTALFGEARLATASFLHWPAVFLLAWSALALKQRGTSGIFISSQLLTDICVVTGVVYLTGGPLSPFTFLYLFPVMGASLISSRTTALSTAIGCALGYCCLILALTEGWLLLPTGERMIEGAGNGELLQLLGLISGMVLVSVFTSYLGAKMRSSAILVQRSQEDLNELKQKQQFLVDGIPEGIITTTIDGTITSINQTSVEMFGIHNTNSVGKGLDELLQQAGLGSYAHELKKSDGPIDITLQNPSSNTVRHLCAHKRKIVDNDGNHSGTLYILQDTTLLRSVQGQLQLQEQMARLLSSQTSPERDSRSPLSDFVGESVVMQKVFNLIERVAPSDATVLISGESGTGKELVARSIHRASGRRNKPFVAVNCGAIPENLIESELFGHKRGSFTGAESDHTGLFRQADGGTLLLDEIGELPLALQAKLLRTLQSRTVRPVGGDRDIPIDVRIVAASNRNIKREVERAAFREDLFYRLNVITINLPPLRERKGDIPILMNALLKRLVKSGATPVIPPATMQLLVNYPYPGNVRELENILERAYVLGGEVILPEHLPEAVRLGAASETGYEPVKTTQIIEDDSITFPIKLDELLSVIERKYLEAALLQTDGARKRAAELLGLNFRSFRYRLQKFGIVDEESAKDESPQ